MVRINQDKCIKCGICKKVCPLDVVESKDTVYIIDRTICIGCGICIEKCPVRIIEWDYEVRR